MSNYDSQHNEFSESCAKAELIFNTIKRTIENAKEKSGYNAFVYNVINFMYASGFISSSLRRELLEYINYVQVVVEELHEEDEEQAADSNLLLIDSDYGVE